MATKKTETVHERALHRPCPKCGAGVDQPCRTYKGARKPPCRDRTAQVSVAPPTQLELFPDEVARS